MNPTDTGTIVTSTLCVDTPRSAEELSALVAPKRRPIDLSDMPEADIDSTWVMPGAGNCFGLTDVSYAGNACAFS